MPTDMDSETFFPRTPIWIRDCMRMIFKKFVEDKPKTNSNRVLLGSPGVGKSILFFIAAMYKALHGEGPVVYVRNTVEELDISAFGMFRSADGLKIISCRNIDKLKFASSPYVMRGVSSCFGLKRRGDNVQFLDGPRHDDHLHLNSFYTYFCTSDGHPIPKNAQLDTFLWLLDGWSMEEAVTFGRITGHAHQYLDAYQNFGGCIRDMNRYVTGSDKTKKYLLAKLKGLTRCMDGKEMSLVLRLTTRPQWTANDV